MKLPVGVDSSLPAIDRRMLRNISELRLNSANTPPSLIAVELSLRNDQGKCRGLLLREILRLASRMLASAPATPTALLATVRNSSSLSREKDLWRGSRNFCRFSLLANVIRLLSVGSRRLETQLTLRLILLWGPVQTRSNIKYESNFLALWTCRCSINQGICL